MTLRDYIKLHSNDEIEVWDSEVDIPIPFYLYGENTYRDNEDEHYLFQLENILLGLEVSNCHKETCCIDVFSLVKKNWKKLYKLYTDLPFEEVNDDESIADCVEDVFKVMSQGYYELGKKFAKALKED